MKHQLALILLLIAVIYAMGQPQARGQSTVPIYDVQESFFSDFPNAEKPSWTKEGAYYYVSFVQKTLNMRAKYTLTGTWLSTVISIKEAQLPQITRQYLTDKYADYSIVSIRFHDAVGNAYYQLAIQKGSVKKTLHFHENGNFWK